MKILKRIKNIIMSLKYYVIADPSDNSITLSDGLFNHIIKHYNKYKLYSVFVFRIADHTSFGFMIVEDMKEKTQLCQIQYNEKYKSIGFETLCPSVGRIFYEYGLPYDKKCKLSVSVKKTGTGKIYYEFDVPNLKHIERCKAYSEIREKKI